jgi:hypothetical protein
VDSANVFHLIEEILNQPRNNPVQTFERFTDIEDWLREQWAGLFRDLLKRVSQQQQLRALSDQISEMTQLNETLKTYMETVVTNVAPNEASSLISEETKRLSDSRLLREAAHNPVVDFLEEHTNATKAEVIDAIVNAKSAADLRSKITDYKPNDYLNEKLDQYLKLEKFGFIKSLNEVREIFDRPPLRRLRQNTTSK